MVMTKCTLLIESRSANSQADATRSRIAGWSESWYDEGPFSETKRAYTISLAQKRAALLPTGSSVVGQRYQEVDPIGASSTGSRVFAGGAGLQADIPQMALLLRIPGVGVKNFRPFYLRGLPDARVNEGEYSPSSIYTNKLIQFLLELEQWNFRGRNLAATTVPILTIDNAGVFQLEADSAIAVNDMVRVLRTNLATGGQFGGRFRVSAKPTARTGTLADWTAGPAAGGRIRADSIIYPVVPGGLKPEDVISRVVTRKVGRPFAGYSGRDSR